VPGDRCRAWGVGRHRLLDRLLRSLQNPARSELRIHRVLLALAAVLLASGAAAEDPERPGYVVFRGGGYVPQSATFSAYPSSFLLEVAVGWRVLPWLPIEVSAGWTDVLASIQQYPTLLRERFTLYPVAVTGRVEIPAGPVRPYLLAGVGLDVTRFVRDTGEGGTSWSSSSADPALEAGAGLRANLGDRVSASAEGRYRFSHTRVFGEGAREMNALEILAGLGYAF